jgi:hypothetical protein
MNMLPTHFCRALLRRTSAALLAVCLSGAMLAPAQWLEYEGFDYSGIALNGQNGGTGWAGWLWQDPDADAPLSNDGVSLAYPVTVSHTPVGSRLNFALSGEALRQLGTPMSLGQEGSNYFFSALVRRQGNFKFEFRDAAGNVRWHFGGTNAADAILGIADNNPAQIVVVPNVFPVDETVLVTAKLATRSTLNDQVFIHIYRAGHVLHSSEPVFWQGSASGGSGVILTNFQVRNLSDLPLEVDEIRLARDWTNASGAIPGGPPVIVTQPASLTVYEGANAQFFVEANGVLPLSFQWHKDGSPLSGSTNAVLLLSNVTPAQAGNYTVFITNSIGWTNSSPATLTVTAFTNVTVGLNALWHFDESSGLAASDATGNGNNGALINYSGDAQWVPSDYTRALAFNSGISNLVAVPDSPFIGSRLLNRFSVAGWFRSAVPLSANGGTFRMLEKENSFFLIQGDGNVNALGIGGISVLVKKATVNMSIGVGQALDANRWYHVAATYDGVNLRIYLDGELKGTRTVAAPIDGTTLPLHIGADYSAANVGTRYFNGAIDELGIWERPLQEPEILDLAGKFGPPVILEQPQSQTRFVGGSAVFRVRANGQLPLRYLWFHGTNEIRTATEPVLTLVNVQLADAGEYRCLVSNDVSAVFSDTAILTVTPVTSIADGSEALWKFDDGSGFVAVDSSGHGRDGQLVDFPDPDLPWIAGQVNSALTFDGQSNRVVAANSSSMTLGSDASFAFWIRPTSYGTLQNAATYLFNTGRVLRKGTQIDIETVDDPGTVRATLRVNGIPAPQNSVQLNQWQHFVIVYSGGTLTFYRNGFRLGDPVAGSLGPTNANPVLLGSFVHPLTTTNMFAGAMDEVGIWSRTLSESEILGLALRDVTGPPVIVTQPQSLTRYVGGSAAFLVEATGKRPVSYHWQHNGNPILDSNTNRLVLTNLTLAQAGNYTVIVSNDLNFTVSTPPAALTVLQITNVADGIVAYWPFDETSGTTFLDASGHGHHAALQNGVAVPGIVGMIGGAYNFDGQNDFAIVPNAAELNLADQASISVWVNPRSLGAIGGLGRLVRKDINFDFTLVAAANSFRVFGLNKAQYDAPPNSVTTNGWQHLAVVARDGTFQFFRNGRALANPIPGQWGPETLSPLIIANFGPDLSINRLLDGYMDDLGIWNRALSAAEVDGIYQNGLVGNPLNAPFDPFTIHSITFPALGQVRLVFHSPFTDRQHAVERKDQLDAPWTNQTGVTFSDLGAGLTEAVFPSPVGSGAFYRVAALPAAAIFFENFESGAAGWTHGGAGDEWELGTPVNGPGAAFSGVNVYATDLDGNIEAFSDEWLRSPPINLVGVPRATLKFQEWRNVDPDPTFHGTIVNVLDAGTLAIIQQLSLQAGSTTGYDQRILQLPPQALGRNVIIEFRLYCDGFNLLEGWYIDDVEVAPE